MSDSTETANNVPNGMTKNVANGSPVKSKDAEVASVQTKTPVKEPQVIKPDEESRDSTVQSASVDDEEDLSENDAHDEEEDQDDEGDDVEEPEEQEAENGKHINGESKSLKRSAVTAVEDDEEVETSQKKKRVEAEDSAGDAEVVASTE